MMFKHANISSKAARIFSVIYGLDWVATVPPTVKLAFGPPAFAEMVLRLAVIAALVLDGSLTRLRGVPEIAIENVQFRHFLGDPFGFRVGPRPGACPYPGPSGNQASQLKERSKCSS
jgi:hypothetical protein